MSPSASLAHPRAPSAIAPPGLRLNTQDVTANATHVRAGRAHRLRLAPRGFTLVELLTVVAITGILATVAFASLRKYVSSARGAEALAVVQSIRAAEERWRAEHMTYLDVSASGLWFPRDPRDAPNTEQAFFYPPGSTAHIDNPLWLQLRPTIAGPVRFGYMVNAGAPGTDMTAAATEGPAVTWPEATDNWYVIQAIGDADWDGDLSYYRASSLDNEVFSVNHGE